MSFGGFLDSNNSGGGGGGGRNIAADVPYSNGNTTNDRMAFGAISQPRLVTTTPSLAKPMFTSPGLSLALVRDLVSFLSSPLHFLLVVTLFLLCFLICFPFCFLCLENKFKSSKAI